MNRRKLIKKLALLTAMLMVTFLLAGCGSAGVTSGSVRVQVVEMVDQSESIITNALVGIESSSEGGNSSASLHRQFSTPNGNGNTYVFEDLPPNVVYDVYSEASGYINEAMTTQEQATGGAPRRADAVADRAYKRITVEDGQDYFVKLFMKKNPNPATGSISGYVRGIDPNGGGASTPLANSTVVIQNSDSSVAFSAVTDTNGYYFISSVPIEPQGYKISCYPANDYPNIYKPLETTGSSAEGTGNGSNSEIFLVPGDTVRKDIYLEKDSLEPQMEDGGTITALVQSAEGIAIDFTDTPIFATLYRDGAPYLTKKVEDGGLVTFDNLPISDNGVAYSRMDIFSAFIDGNAPTQTFNATLKTTNKSYSLATPFEITLKKGDVTVNVGVSWGSATVAWNTNDRVDFVGYATGSSDNATISINYANTSGTAIINDVPIGKRKINGAATGYTASGGASVAAQLAPAELEVTIVKGANNIANFGVTASKQ